MRICLVTRGYAGVSASHGGGLGTRYACLGPELARRGHETHAVTASQDRRDVVESEGVLCHLVPRRMPHRLWFAEELPWSVSAARVLRELGHFDVVFSPEWGAGAWAYARRRDSGPLVTNLTTSMEQMRLMSPGWRRTFAERAGNAVQARLERDQAERSDALVACSEAILAWARRLWKLEEVPSVALPNFIDVARTRALADGPLPEGFPSDGPIVLFSGRLEIRKGVHVLGEAMRLVWERRPTARLVALGRDSRGDMSRHLHRSAGPYSDRLHLLGDQPHERLFPAILASDVVALPSLWEAFGLAALEAMALGRPCVLTRGSGFEEFFRDGEHGLLVPPRDASALAHAMSEMLGDPAMRDRMGTAAAAAADAYSAAAVTPAYLSYFARIAEER